MKIQTRQVPVKIINPQNNLKYISKASDIQIKEWVDLVEEQVFGFFDESKQIFINQILTTIKYLFEQEDSEKMKIFCLKDKIVMKIVSALSIKYDMSKENILKRFLNLKSELNFLLMNQKEIFVTFDKAQNFLSVCKNCQKVKPLNINAKINDSYRNKHCFTCSINFILNPFKYYSQKKIFQTPQNLILKTDLILLFKKHQIQQSYTNSQIQYFQAENLHSQINVSNDKQFLQKKNIIPVRSDNQKDTKDFLRCLINKQGFQGLQNFYEKNSFKPLHIKKILKSSNKQL